MVQYKKLLINVARYLIIFVVMFIIIYIIPNSDTKLKIKDVGIMTLIIVLILAILEHIYGVLQPDEQVKKFETFIEETIPEEPVIEEPVIEEPVIEEPVIEEPVIEKPVIEKPVIKEHVIEKSKVDNEVGSKTESEAIGSRKTDGVIKNELPYTDYHHLPLGDYYKPDDFEYGFSFLPPEKWYPQPPFPPVCVCEKKCPVTPMYTTGVPLDIKEWDSSRRITPADNINTDYIKEKLNSGR